MPSGLGALDRAGPNVILTFLACLATIGTHVLHGKVLRRGSAHLVRARSRTAIEGAHTRAMADREEDYDDTPLACIRTRVLCIATSPLSPFQTCGLLLAYPHEGELFGLEASGPVQNRLPLTGLARRRKYPSPDGARRLIKAAGRVGRQPERDTVLLTLMYRHGLRVNEAINLRCVDFDLDGLELH